MSDELALEAAREWLQRHLHQHSFCLKNGCTPACLVEAHVAGAVQQVVNDRALVDATIRENTAERRTGSRSLSDE